VVRGGERGEDMLLRKKSARGSARVGVRKRACAPLAAASLSVLSVLSVL
jgi:hypothetical protein